MITLTIKQVSVSCLLKLSIVQREFQRKREITPRIILKIFNEIFRGEKSRKDFFNEILDILTLLGGEVGNVR